MRDVTTIDAVTGLPYPIIVPLPVRWKFGVTTNPLDFRTIRENTVWVACGPAATHPAREDIPKPVEIRVKVVPLFAHELVAGNHVDNARALLTAKLLEERPDVRSAWIYDVVHPRDKHDPIWPWSVVVFKAWTS